MHQTDSLGCDTGAFRLQTCVGKANYVQFFTIACTGTAQFVLQVVYSVLCLVWLETGSEHSRTAASHTELEAILVACLLVSVPCMFMYFVLLGFHVYLMFLGYGTYEWMLRRRKQQRAKAEQRKAQTTESIDSQASTNDPEDRRHLSSVGSGNDFIAADASDAGSTGPRELTSL